MEYDLVLWRISLCAVPVLRGSGCDRTSVMNKTCDPVSIRVQGFDPEFRVPGLVFVAGGGGRFKLSGFLAPVPRHTSGPHAV